MGNCHAAEVSTVLIQHPGGKIERIYWSVSVSQIMSSNPGHYLAVIITSQPPAGIPAAGAGDAPVKHLKLLRPDDTLHVGHVYRLVSFQEVLKEFASKKNVRLSKFVNAAKEKRKSGSKNGKGDPAVQEPSDDGNNGGEAAAPPPRMRQWRPALQSIEEVAGT